MEHWISLAYPIIFLLGGVMSIIAAILDRKTDVTTERLSRLHIRLGKTGTRILYVLIGLALIGFGIYLLHGWLFIPQ